MEVCSVHNGDQQQTEIIIIKHLNCVSVMHGLWTNRTKIVAQLPTSEMKKF